MHPHHTLPVEAQLALPRKLARIHDGVTHKGLQDSWGKAAGPFTSGLGAAGLWQMAGVAHALTSMMSRAWTSMMISVLTFLRTSSERLERTCSTQGSGFRVKLNPSRHTGLAEQGV